MAWVSVVIEVITLAIKYGPEVVALVREILGLVKKTSPAKQSGLLQELEAAVAAYRVDGSKRPLIDLLSRVHDLVL